MSRRPLDTASTVRQSDSVTTPEAATAARCSAGGCGRAVRAGGLCGAHYARRQRGSSDDGQVRPARLGEGDRSRLTVSLSERLRTALDDAAAARGTTPSGYVRALVSAALGVP